MQLQTSYLFKGLSESQLSRLGSVCVEKKIIPGQIIFREGGHAAWVYVLKEGVVELFASVDAETELPVSMLREAGYGFGLACLVPPYRYTLSARCQEAGSVIAFEQRALEDLFSKDRDLSLVIMSNMSRHLLETIVEMRRELKIHFKNLFHSERY